MTEESKQNPTEVGFLAAKSRQPSPPAPPHPHGPLIAITCGEPAGIGPELCLQLVAAHPERPGGPPTFPARLVVLGDRDLLAERARQCGLQLGLRDWPGPDAAPPPPGTLDVLHLPLAVPCSAGQLATGNARQVLALLDRAISGCQHGEFAAMVTAPLHKGVINEALGPGQHFSGHTEYLAEKTGTPRVVMMLAGDLPAALAPAADVPADVPHALRVALVTTHLPLRAVAAAITPEAIASTLRIVDQALRERYGITAPRLLVTGLNPHAGEGGHLGREEIEVISPTLDALRREGLRIEGPLPADTLFTPPILQRGDAVVAMYHDQGLTALKFATFGQGINVTLGLPIIRTSVDHGTALDLAGQGRADPGSLYTAVNEAIRMASSAPLSRSKS